MDIDAILNPKPPATPRGLATRGPGRALWRAVVREFALRPDELVLLEQAARTLDELVVMREALALVPSPVVNGGRGAVTANPIHDQIRRHTSLLQGLLGGLGLDAVDANPSAASQAGRALVGARWRRGGR